MAATGHGYDNKNIPTKVHATDRKKREPAHQNDPGTFKNKRYKETHPDMGKTREKKQNSQSTQKPIWRSQRMKRTCLPHQVVGGGSPGLGEWWIFPWKFSSFPGVWGAFFFNLLRKLGGLMEVRMVFCLGSLNSLKPLLLLYMPLACGRALCV